MLSYEQEKKIRENIVLVVDILLRNGCTIENIEKITNIPTSTIQRYLNDTKRIELIYGSNAKDILLAIEARLNYNKIIGNYIGGLNYSQNNNYIKANDGKFMGSRAR